MKMFLFAIGGPERASSRLRVWDHVAALRAMGHTVEVDSVVAPGASATGWRFALRMLAKYPGWLRRFFAADAVILQETMALWPALLLSRFGKRRRVMFDFSDPVDRIGKRPWVRAIRRRLLRFVAGRVDAVMVENGAYRTELAERGVEVHRFYGPVDVARYDAARVRVTREGHERFRIGWTGSPGTYHFIAPLLPQIDALAENVPVEIVLIGVERTDYTPRHATLTLLPWCVESEFQVVPTFDLGLFRIDESEDAMWRGAGKLFIYMAASVPFIATDRGIARDLMAESGLGFPVGGEAGGWLDGLRGAVVRTAMRESFGARSLAFAQTHLSYEKYRATILGILAARDQHRNGE